MKHQALTQQVALALGAMPIHLNQGAGRLSPVPLDVPRVIYFRDLARRLQADEQVRRALRLPGTAVLGVDHARVPLLLRLSSPYVAHCLITGITGSGKTELLRTIVSSVVQFQKPHDIQLALFDLEGRGLLPFAGVPHLRFGLVREPRDMIARLQELVEEMERRAQVQVEHPRLVVVVDDLAGVLQIGGEALADLLTCIAQRGRGAGISLIAATQKPTAQAVGRLLKADLPIRIVGRISSPDEARAAGGISGSGAARLSRRGDFVLVAGGEQIPFQAAYVGPGKQVPALNA